jgi:hypothetical protein
MGCAESMKIFSSAVFSFSIIHRSLCPMTIPMNFWNFGPITITIPMAMILPSKSCILHKE